MRCEGCFRHECICARGYECDQCDQCNENFPHHDNDPAACGCCAKEPLCVGCTTVCEGCDEVPICTDCCNTFTMMGGPTVCPDCSPGMVEREHTAKLSTWVSDSLKLMAPRAG